MSKMSEYDNFGVEEMSKEEYAKKQDYVTKSCLCTKCPTYVQGDSPIGYCFPLVGVSRNIKWEKGCICETCPVFKEYELTHTFYCTRCSQVCQTHKTEAGGGHE